MAAQPGSVLIWQEDCGNRRLLALSFVNRAVLGVMRLTPFQKPERDSIIQPKVARNELPWVPVVQIHQP